MITTNRASVSRPHNASAGLLMAERHLPTVLYENPQVRAWWLTIQPTIGALYQAQRDLARIVGDVRTLISAIGLDKNLSLEGRSAQQNQVRRNALLMVDKVFQSASAAQAALTDAVAAALQLPKPDDTDANRAVLAERRMQAAWNRLKPRIEAARDPYRELLTVAGEIVAAQDLDAHRAILRELPDWCRVQNWNAEAVCAHYGDATETLLTDVQRAARIVEGLLTRGSQVLAANLSSVRRELQQTGTGLEFIVGFFEGEEVYRPNDRTTDRLRGLASDPYSVVDNTLPGRLVA